MDPKSRHGPGEHDSQGSSGHPRGGAERVPPTHSVPPLYQAHYPVAVVRAGTPGKPG